MTGTTKILTVYCCSGPSPFAFVAVTPNVYVPALVGVPLIIPVFVSSTSPSGRLLDDILHAVTGTTGVFVSSGFAASDCEYALPINPS
jgi:hypothetical protein